MATSSKVMFKLEVLRAKALESIDFRIATAELEVQSYIDDGALRERQADWREETINRLRDFVALIDSEEGVDNHQLNKFKLRPIPEVDRYDRARANDKLRDLQSRRTKIEAKAGSLVPDADGNIALTKTQLQEFFAL